MALRRLRERLAGAGHERGVHPDAGVRHADAGAIRPAPDVDRHPAPLGKPDGVVEDRRERAAERVAVRRGDLAGLAAHVDGRRVEVARPALDPRQVQHAVERG
ncbi:hypothetical protein RQM47_05420 [Rubrivirga sp. S365]|nr:hypothetical protein [Rubrivirga sp. S365]MDT7856074.1 hypothetical protein [Rubrivirga sp. S365]